MKTIYWISTLLTAVYLTWSAYSYLFSQAMIEGLKKFGFPNFFRIELAVLKFIAVVILLIPQVPLQVKDWAYAGVGCFYLTAIIGHWAHKDPWVINLLNVFLFVVLVVSNIYLRKLNA
ncbi:MAG TPA: DoxX family protein [Cytophagales bacterium]|nr:DoxX family protein [Cytophagales bacterium]HAA18060.1 DoxX family protein [Cytophagales bacterium]HAP62390.1 DoxX family protein [Cytophagales bacterium]